MSEGAKVAVILALDVAGFSKSMHADRNGTIAHITAMREHVWVRAVEDHGGQIFKHTGDGFLARFNGTRVAFQCALNLLEGSANKEFPVRIGVHLGEVIEQNDDLFGDLINIACRIEAITPLNSICISERVWLDFDNRVNDFVRLRKTRLKNISTDIRIFLYRPNLSRTGRFLVNARNILPRKGALLLYGALIFPISAFLYFNMPSAFETQTAEKGLQQVLSGLPCSWLRLTEVGSTEKRERFRVDGFAELDPLRLRRLLEMRSSGSEGQEIDVDVDSVKQPPRNSCKLLETASRYRYRGLARIYQKEANVSEDEFVAYAKANSTQGRSEASWRAEYRADRESGAFEIYANDFSNAAWQFRVDSSGAIFPEYNITTLKKVNNGGSRTAAKDIVFIVDARDHFDPKQVARLLQDDWKGFYRLADQKGLTIELAIAGQ